MPIETAVQNINKQNCKIFNISLFVPITTMFWSGSSFVDDAREFLQSSIVALNKFLVLTGNPPRPEASGIKL